MLLSSLMSNRRRAQIRSKCAAIETPKLVKIWEYMWIGSCWNVTTSIMFTVRQGPCIQNTKATPMLSSCLRSTWRNLIRIRFMYLWRMFHPMSKIGFSISSAISGCGLRLHTEMFKAHERRPKINPAQPKGSGEVLGQEIIMQITENNRRRHATFLYNSKLFQNELSRQICHNRFGAYLERIGRNHDWLMRYTLTQRPNKKSMPT